MTAFLAQYKARFEQVASDQLNILVDRAKKAARKGINAAAATFFTDLAFLISSDLVGPPPFLEPFGLGYWAPLADVTVHRKSAHGIAPPAYFRESNELWTQLAGVNPARVFGEPTARSPASVRFSAAGGINQFTITVSIFPNLSPDAPDIEIAEMLEEAGVVKGVAKFMNLGRGGERAYRPLLGPYLREFITLQAPRLVRRALEQEGFKVR